MSRLYSTGFELNSATSGVEGDTHNLTSISSSVVRSGAYALRCNAAGNTPFYRTHLFAADSSSAIGYLRAYIYIDTSMSANTQIMRFVNSSNGPQVSIQLTTTNTLQLRNNLAVQIGSDSAALSNDTWYRLELSFNPATGAVEARIDGTSFASGSTATGSWSRIIVGVITGTPTGDMYVDDVAVNDDSGSFQNTWPGSGKIIVLKPNAAGDNTGLTTGVSDNTNHYLNVDEVTPDDDTSYNQTSTASQIDDYNLEASGLGASDIINVVAVGVRYRKVTSGTLVFKVRAKAAAAGTVEASPNISSATTTFSTNAEATPKLYPLTMYDLPGASTTPWSTADLDQAQIGVETVSNTANNWRFTKIWMLVEYVPNASPNPTNLFFF